MLFTDSHIAVTTLLGKCQTRGKIVHAVNSLLDSIVEECHSGSLQ